MADAPIENGIIPPLKEYRDPGLERKGFAERNSPGSGQATWVVVAGISGCLKKMLHPLTKGVKYERCVFRRVRLIFS